MELLSQGVDITVSSSVSNNTPLHFACLNNNKAVAEVLLRSGADPSVPNADGLIPAELTTDASIRESLLNTNWMSQRNTYPAIEQQRQQQQNDNHVHDELMVNLQEQEQKQDTNTSAPLSQADQRPVCASGQSGALLEEDLITAMTRASISPRISLSSSTACNGTPDGNDSLNISTGCSSDALVTPPPRESGPSKVSQTLLDNKELSQKILQAVASTAECAATMHVEFSQRSELFKICSRTTLPAEMAEKLSVMLTNKPELALCRAVDMGNKASDGWTPLHCASKFGNMKAIELLLQRPDVTGWECDLLGRLPLHVAAGKSNTEVCTVLMQTMQQHKTEALGGGEEGEGGETSLFSTPPSASSSSSSSCCLVGPHAPVDAGGTTPLGSATREGKGKPSTAIRELLYQPRDSSIFASSPFVTRSGRTPLKRVNSLRLRSIAKSTAKERVVQEEKGKEGEKEGPTEETFAVNLLYAHSEAQGWRGEMEDQTILQCPIRREDESPVEMKWCCFGVLDGAFCSRWCVRHRYHLCCFFD